MKKKILGVLLIGILGLVTIGCENQADIVSHNISKEADNFNMIRQLTVMNCIQGDVLFQIAVSVM